MPIECLKCGYDLRFIARIGTCPECGLSISESLKNSKLRLRAKCRKLMTLVIIAILIVTLIGRYVTLVRPIHPIVCIEYRKIIAIAIVLYTAVLIRLVYTPSKWFAKRLPAVWWLLLAILTFEHLALLNVWGAASALAYLRG